MGAKLSAVILGLLVGLLWLVYTAWQDMSHENRTLVANQATLESAVSEQNSTIQQAVGALDEWKQDRAEFQDTLLALQTTQVEASQEARELNRLLAKHDLTELTKRKPGLLERRANRATAESLRLLECATGAGGSSCSGGTAQAD